MRTQHAVFLRPIDMSMTLNLCNQVEEISRLADFLEELGREMNLPRAMLHSLNLALEEAIANVIFYAYPRDERHEICLNAERVGDMLCFRLVDSGLAFDPTQIPPPDITLPAEERPIGGLGIFMMRQIMDQVEYSRVDGLNVLIMKKKVE